MKLLSPIRVRNLEIRNRIVMAALHLGYARDGFVSERLARFYEERSRGGAGLIMVGGCEIDRDGYPTMPAVSDDKYIPGLQELTGRVRKGGAAVGCQIFHAGRYAFSALTGVQSVAPSPVASALTREVPRELSTEEVYEIIRAFGQAARRVREGGFDLVEVIGGAGYLVSQFLSPLTNLRSDEFGGPLENRMRFGLEVVREVRRQVGDDFPISFRFAGNELMPGGTPRKELLAFAAALEQAGVDMFNVTGGWHESHVPQLTMNVPPGAFVYLASAVKAEVGVPVAASNRINDPLLAERILLEGRADMVTMARALIADPELPVKAKEGRFEDIRPCIACNQGCLDHVFEARPVGCLVNARAGHEAERQISPADIKKKVLVVGGGPGGMEAARVAALRGHDVTLWEQSSELGGQLKLAAVPPGRGDFMRLVTYLRESLRSTGVKVSMNQKADAESVRLFAPDVVVIATGALPASPHIPGVELPHVYQAWDVLKGNIPIGREIVVIGGGAVGCETALYLAQVGAVDDSVLRFLLVHGVEEPEDLKKLATTGITHVTIVEQAERTGRDIGRSTRWVISRDLPRYGVEVMTSSRVVAIEPEGVTVETENGTASIPADMVVLAVGSVRCGTLADEVAALVPEIHVIGDAVAPRKAEEAIREGFLVGASL